MTSSNFEALEGTFLCSFAQITEICSVEESWGWTRRTPFQKSVETHTAVVLFTRPGGLNGLNFSEMSETTLVFGIA